MIKRLGWLGRLSMASAGILLACGGDDAPNETIAMSELELGAAVYAQQCAGCHGESGQGSRACLTLITPHINKQSDARLYALISAGTGGTMPAFGDTLGQDEILAVISHLRAIQEPSIVNDEDE